MLSSLPFILAETTEQEFHFELHNWIPTVTELIRATATGVGIFSIGLLVYVWLRKYIARTKLTAAALVLISALAIYFGFVAGKPLRLLDTKDYAAIWITRFFFGAILFSALRALDRLLIVPVLTRGGRVPVQRFIHQIINIVIALFSVMWFGSWAFGWNIQALLAGSAVVSIVLGLALQETLGNFFSGLVMQASSPFAIGDWIICAGVEGRVVDMNWRAVTIHTTGRQLRDRPQRDGGDGADRQFQYADDGDGARGSGGAALRSSAAAGDCAAEGDGAGDGRGFGDAGAVCFSG
jgi:small-conductance mechanosensitive channel